MANRIPLVVDSSNFRIEELPAGDTLDLGSADIVNATFTGINTFTDRVDIITTGTALGISTSSNTDKNGFYFTHSTTGISSVGIGTTMPYARLHIYDDSYESAGFGVAGVSSSPAIQIGGIDTYRLGFYTDNEKGYIDGRNGDNGVSIKTKRYGGVAPWGGVLDRDSVTVTAEGGLGIGTTAFSDSHKWTKLVVDTSELQTQIATCFYGQHHSYYSAKTNFLNTKPQIVLAGFTTENQGTQAIMRCVSGTDAGQGATDAANIGALQILLSSDGFGSLRNCFSVTHGGTGGLGAIGIGTTTPNDQLNTYPKGSVGATNGVAVADTSGRYQIHSYREGESFWLCESKSLNTGNETKIMCGVGSHHASIGLAKNATVSIPVGYVQLEQQDSTAQFLHLDTSANLRITTAFSSVGSDVGTVIGDQTSDERLKNVGVGVDGGLDKIMQLNPVHFTYKSNPERERLGFIAQEVQNIVPQAVYNTGNSVVGVKTEFDLDGALAMEYHALIPVLVKAIQELKAEVDALKGA